MGVGVGHFRAWEREREISGLGRGRGGFPGMGEGAGADPQGSEDLRAVSGVSGRLREPGVEASWSRLGEACRHMPTAASSASTHWARFSSLSAARQ